MITCIKKTILPLVGIVSLLSLPSCEEEDAPLIFTEVSSTSVENVKFEYYSPDPCCLPRMNWLTANGNASEITLKCTNATDISIVNHNGQDIESYTSTSGQWKVELVYPNSITFTFYEFDDTDTSDEFASTDDWIKICTQSKKGKVDTSVSVISVQRIARRDITLN